MPSSYQVVRSGDRTPYTAAQLAELLNAYAELCESLSLLRATELLPSRAMAALDRVDEARSAR